jgi:hypothetical protein
MPRIAMEYAEELEREREELNAGLNTIQMAPNPVRDLTAGLIQDKTVIFISLVYNHLFKARI